LESDKAGLVNELQQANNARQELERRKKQSDQQIQELTTRLAEAERGRTDFTDKSARIQVCY
jgi:chaperonin cofactor prefoldin